jgi:hypothetical protein
MELLALRRAYQRYLPFPAGTSSTAHSVQKVEFLLRLVPHGDLSHSPFVTRFPPAPPHSWPHWPFGGSSRVPRTTVGRTPNQTHGMGTLSTPWVPGLSDGFRDYSSSQQNGESALKPKRKSPRKLKYRVERTRLEVLRRQYSCTVGVTQRWIREPQHTLCDNAVVVQSHYAFVRAERPCSVRCLRHWLLVVDIYPA